MNCEYKINELSDFQTVIDDILNWYQKSNLETLVITLKGDLGVGKTAFTKILGKYLKVEEFITSPTFTIMKQYPVLNEQFDQLVHIDAYRIDSEEEIEPLRLREIFKKPRTIICIEWPEQIPSVIPSSAVRIEIVISEGETRIVKVLHENIE